MSIDVLVGGYVPDQPVWVWSWCFGRWRPGTVLSASAHAVLVRYQPTDQHGAAVDTVTPDLVTHRPTPHHGVAAPTGPDPPGPDRAG